VPGIAVHTLTDGGQKPLAIAKRLAAFVGEARKSLDIAVYDLKLDGELAAVVVDAIRGAAARGVAVRFAYNVDHRRPIAVPPPSRMDTDLVAQLDVPSEPIPGIPDLMHHKT
jgi:phosphatidylserine/phosphatidylglycerophosphate/cardiolipin synthase-like enzyme